MSSQTNNNYEIDSIPEITQVIKKILKVIMKNNISGEPIKALFFIARKEQVWILIFF